MVRVTIRGMTVVLATLMLAACGGGGDSGSDQPAGLTISVSPVTATFPQIQLPSFVTVPATVTGNLTVNTVYVVIADSAATFSGTPTILQNSPTQYAAGLMVPETLGMGTYTGTLTISVCSDAQCAGVLGRTTTPYTVVIGENPVLTSTWKRNNVTLLSAEGEAELPWPVVLNTPSTGHILYARFSDPTNIVRVVGASQPLRIANSSTEELDVTVSASAPPGTHTGFLDAVFCRDINCTRAYRGVTRLAYIARVSAATNLKPLAPLAGAPDWTMRQGNAARTGYVPVTLNAANFSQRWKWVSTDPDLNEYLDPVTAGGKVFVIAAPYAGYRITPVLHAIDEASGVVAWSRPMPDSTLNHGSGLGPLLPAAISGSNVYVVRTTHTYPSEQGLPMGFKIADGAPTFTPISHPDGPSEFGEYAGDWYASTYFRPSYLTPNNGEILLGTRGVGGLGFASLDASSGIVTKIWPSCAPLNGYGKDIGGSIAIDANQNALVATNEGLVIANTCQLIASSVPVGNGTGPIVAPGTSDVIAVGNGKLVAFDTASMQFKWSPTGTFVGSPAVSGGVVYVANNSRHQLEARRLSDGQVQWSWSTALQLWPDDTGFIGNVIATQNLIFASTGKRIYAIDIATHQTVWMYPYSGRLAMSANGILYISRGGLFEGRDGIVAINLR